MEGRRLEESGTGNRRWETKMIGAREVVGVLRLPFSSLRRDSSFSSVVQPCLLGQTSQATILLCLLPTYFMLAFPF